jgi:erythromycin esterase-like protein
MAKDDFAEVQRKLEATASELKTANDPERRRALLREMSRLVAEAERISSQPPKLKDIPRPD